MAGLARVPFTADLLPLVQDFDCGSEPWEREVSDWLKSSSGALEAIRMGTSVWLYVTDAADVVGFGSLAVGRLRYPRPKDAFINVMVIPYLGLGRRYWGEPKDDPEGKYSVRILNDLITDARRYQDECPLLVLYVAAENTRAIRFYQREGFKELHKPYLDKATGRACKRMFFVLHMRPDDPGPSNPGT